MRVCKYILFTMLKLMGLPLAAESLFHLQANVGANYTVLQDGNSSNASLAKLISNAEPEFQALISYGKGGDDWYLSFDSLNYSFLAGTSSSPTVSGLTGTQTQYELGRRMLFKDARSIAVQLGANERDIIYLYGSGASYSINKQSLPGVQVLVDFPLFRWGQRSSSTTDLSQPVTGLHFALGGAYSFVSGVVDSLTSVLGETAQISLRKAMSHSWELDLSVKYGIENLKSSLFSQTRNDLGFYLSILGHP